MAYRPPHTPGQVSGYGMVPPAQMYMAGNYNANGNQQPRPGNAQFMQQPRSFAGVAPQRYPMMQPGMVPGGYAPQMYPGQILQQGVMGMGQLPMGYPQQTQQMMGQQQFPAQQMPQQQGPNPMLEQHKRLAEAQQKLSEKQKKERYLEDQRRKLRQFSKGGTAALGTSKLDFDNLMSTGGKEVGKGGGGSSMPILQPQQQKKVTPVNQPAPEEDDSFGDFLQGPTTATTSQTNVVPSTSTGGEDDFGDFLAGPTASSSVKSEVDVTKPAVSQPQVDDFGDLRQGSEDKSKQQETVAGAAVEMKDDKVLEQKASEGNMGGPTLESMMLASADFSASRACKTKPSKPCLRDSTPKTNSSSATKQQAFENSPKVQAWSGTQDFSSSMFNQVPGQFPGQLPGHLSSQVPGQVMGQISGLLHGGAVGVNEHGVQQGGRKTDGRTLPPWCLNEASLPLVYQQVLEASSLDGVIQTELVYPILILSGLDKSVLGYIWNMANQTMPGRLTKQELFFALGLIALAQNGQPLNTETIMGVKEALIPKLTPSQVQTASQVNSGSTQQHSTASSLGSATVLGEDTEFAAFQAARKIGESSTPLPSTGAAPTHQSGTVLFAATTILLPGSSSAISSTSAVSSAIPTLSISKAGSGGPSNAAVSSSTPVTMKLGDMGKLDDQGYDARYPKEEENCYIFAGSPPESESSGRSSPLVWDPNCIYDKLTIRSKDDSESTSSLSDHTPIDDEDEEQFDDFKSAPLANTKTHDDDAFSDFQKARQEQESERNKAFVFHKVKLRALAKLTKNPFNIPPPHSAAKSLTGSAATVKFVRSVSSEGQPKDGLNKMGKFASFDSGMSGRIPKPLPAVTTDKFGNIKQGGVSHDDAFAPFQDSPKKSVSVTDFTAFQSAKTTTSSSGTASEPNFADFAQFKHSASESDLIGMAPSQEDKYAALRSLISDTPASQPEFGIGLAATPEELDEDDFEDFQQAEPIGITSEQDDDGFESFKQASPAVAMEDSFSDFQQADSVQSSETNLFGSLSSQPHKPVVSMDLFAKQAAPGNLVNSGVKPISLLRSSVLLSNQQPSNSWVDNIPMDRELPPDDDFGDFQTTSEPIKSTPDTLSVGKSDDSGSLNDFKKASASDLYGMEFDAFGSLNEEDSNCMPSLNLDDQPTPEEPPKPIDPALLFNSQSSGKLPKVSNIDSLDLTTFDLDLNLGNGSKAADEGKDDRSNSFGDFSSAPVMSPMDKSTDVTMSMQSGALVLSTAPLVPQGTALIGDRYSQVAGEIQDDNRHAQEWKRCLENCYLTIKKANDVFNGISSSTVCNEVIRSAEGSDYLTAVIEIYRVACRIVTSMKSMGAETEDLQSLEKDIDLVWNNLSAFLAASPLQPDDGSFVFKTAVLRPEPANRDRACGVCLLNVDSRSKAFDHSKDSHKLSYGGRQYHATCANLWVNMVDSILPALPLNSLL